MVRKELVRKLSLFTTIRACIRLPDLSRLYRPYPAGPHRTRPASKARRACLGRALRRTRLFLFLPVDCCACLALLSGSDLARSSSLRVAAGGQARGSDGALRGFRTDSLCIYVLAAKLRDGQKMVGPELHPHARLISRS